MGFRFRRSIRLAKGLRINLSKTGASLSVGRPGATVNYGPRGKKVTVGLPGTGLSYSKYVNDPNNPGQPVDNATHDPSAIAQRQSSRAGRVIGWGLFAVLALTAAISIYGAFTGH